MHRLTVCLILLTACNGSEPDDSDSGVVDTETSVFGNSGDPTLEGHTPRGFEGQGGGLFAGDNLNSGFPEGDGVQIFVTLPFTTAMSEVLGAELSTIAPEFRGTPFVDLGALRVERVEFESFSSDLWDLAVSGPGCTLATVQTDAFTCDITEATAAAVAAGRTSLQLRIRFDTAGDSDGSQDMVMFHTGDSNATDAGLFTVSADYVP